jgi:2Fe-2S ferredoxin
MPRLSVIDLTGEQRSIEAASGLSLMENLQNNGVDDILAVCGGLMACATCQVYLDDDWFAKLGPPGEEEAQLLDGLGVRRGTSRLSCQILVHDGLDGLSLTVAPDM